MMMLVVKVDGGAGCMAERIELCWEWLEMLGLNRQKPERAALLESIETPAGITTTLE